MQEIDTLKRGFENIGTNSAQERRTNVGERKLSDQQIEALARPLATYLSKNIFDYYKNPENEAAFQKWHFEKYGSYAPALE